MAAVPAQSPLSLALKRWTREEYYTLAESGQLGPDPRYELLDGYIVEKVTHNPPHANTIRRVQAWLMSVIGRDSTLAAQLPIDLGSSSQPEPDLAVVRGGLDEYDTRHPNALDVELLVEVSHSSIREDRMFKVPLYARAGIREVWILDLTSRKLEMHREPLNDGYQVVIVLAEGESAGPLFAPEAQVRVADLLPPP